MRKELQNRVDFSEEEINDWFDYAKANEVENGVTWINEPFHDEDVYCYLVEGNKADLLIDTGMGIKPIKPLVDKLRNNSKELIVVNTHWHFDHIGGNREFPYVFAPNHIDEQIGIYNGWKKEVMDQYFFSAGFYTTPKYPNNFDLNTFQIEGYKSVRTIPPKIDLGNRTLEVLDTPGHTNGSISLFDRKNGILFPGDLIYEGPLYVFDIGKKETDPERYLQSLSMLSELPIKKIHPAHNHSNVDNFPNLIQESMELFDRALSYDRPDAVSPDFPNVLEYWHPDYDSRKGIGRKLRILVQDKHAR